MACGEAARENLVHRVLHASQALGGIVVLVVDVDVVARHSVPDLLGEQVVVDKRLGRLAGKLHHHAGRGVGIHVGVLTRHVVRLDVDDLEEDVPRLGLARYAPLVAVGDVTLCDILAAALHQLHLDHVLYRLDRHLRRATKRDVIRDLVDQPGILALVRVQHRLADGRSNLLLVESDNAPVALDHCLYHSFA